MWAQDSPPLPASRYSPAAAPSPAGCGLSPRAYGAAVTGSSAHPPADHGGPANAAEAAAGGSASAGDCGTRGPAHATAELGSFRQMPTAYVDESAAPEIGCYLLAAVIVDSAHVDAARAVMRGLRIQPGKLHWHTEGAARRLKIAAEVAALGHVSVVIAGTGVSRRTERGRRKCLEVLLPELEVRGITRAVFETRAAYDRYDLAHAAACRQKRLITDALQVEFGFPNDEPLLWLADAVCGAVLAGRRGDPTFTDMLGEAVHLIEIDAT